MRILSLFLALFCVAISPLFAAPARDGKDFLKVPIAKARAESKWALVIGADAYLNATPLQICGKDARAFRQFLMDKMGFPKESIIFLTDDQPDPRLRPTYTALKKQVNVFLDGVDENSEVVLFFSGHGVRHADRDWLVPLDGDPDSVAETCIDYNALRDRLETKRPKRALLITDACRNLLDGKGITRGSGFGESELAKLPQFGELRSCQPSEVSQWLKDRSMSVFTHYLLAGLSGQAADDTGRVTFDSLRGFVTGKTRQYVAANWQGRQNPDGRASFGEMVLAQVPGQLTPIEPAPKPLATARPAETKPLPVATPTPAPRPLATAKPLPTAKPAAPRPNTNPVPVKPAEQTPWKIDLPLPGGVTGNGPMAGTTRVNPTDGATMVWVPAGEFTRGVNSISVPAMVAYAKASGEGSEEFWFESQTPARKIYLDGFWIGQTEVTNAQYRRFCEATGRPIPVTAQDTRWDNYPITDVNWADARAYALWAGGDLPTEAQWEKAARGPQNFDYPWGNEWDANRSVNRKAGPWPVSYLKTDVSGYGCYDMAGNVSEWCLDVFSHEFYAGSPARNPLNATGADPRWKVARGGDWSGSNPIFNQRTTSRLRLLEGYDDRTQTKGLRVVWKP